MPESVYKVIELVGTSPDSWEKAATAAVKRDSLDAGRDRLRRDRLANGLRGRDVATVLQVTADIRLRARGGNQRLAGRVINDLGVNVHVAYKNA